MSKSIAPETYAQARTQAIDRLQEFIDAGYKLFDALVEAENLYQQGVDPYTGILKNYPEFMPPFEEFLEELETVEIK
jgi:hypothetical protein